MNQTLDSVEEKNDFFKFVKVKNSCHNKQESFIFIFIKLALNLHFYSTSLIYLAYALSEMFTVTFTLHL